MELGILHVTASSQTARQAVPNVSSSWQGHQISSFSYLKRTIPLIVVGLGIAAITQYVIKQYRLQQPVECNFGSPARDIESEQSVAHQQYALSVRLQSKPEDQYCLARSFEEGIGAKTSMDEARKWYKEAAQQGLAVAKDALCRFSMFEGVVLTNEQQQGFRTVCCTPNLSERLSEFLFSGTNLYHCPVPKAGQPGKSPIWQA